MLGRDPCCGGVSKKSSRAAKCSQFVPSRGPQSRSPAVADDDGPAKLD